MSSSSLLQEASDPSTSEARLEAMSKSSNADVRRAVAQNMAAPRSALERLFPRFPEEVLNNPAAALFDLYYPEKSLAWISGKKLKSVFKERSLSVQAMRLLGALNNDLLALELAYFPPTPSDVLDMISRYGRADIGSAIAVHPNALPETLVKVARSNPVSDALKMALLRNPKFPPEHFHLILSGGGTQVAQHLAYRADASEQVLDQIVAMVHGQASGPAKENVLEAVARNYNASEETLRQLSMSHNTSTRMFVAENRSAPEDVLRNLSAEDTWFIQWRVALNPRTPTDVLEQLALSENDKTREAAKKALLERKKSLVDSNPSHEGWLSLAGKDFDPEAAKEKKRLE